MIELPYYGILITENYWTSSSNSLLEGHPRFALDFISKEWQAVIYAKALLRRIIDKFATINRIPFTSSESSFVVVWLELNFSKMFSKKELSLSWTKKL